MFWILAILISGLLSALGGWQLGGNVPAALFTGTIGVLLAAAVHDLSKHRHSIFVGTLAAGVIGFWLGSWALAMPLALLGFLLLVTIHDFTLRKDVELPIALLLMVLCGGIGWYFSAGPAATRGALATVSSLIGALTWVGIYDYYLQRKHAIRRNFPIIGWCRYGFELIGDELRQYWFMNNREERPYDRITRRYLYRSGKGVNNNLGFGTEENYREWGKMHLLPSNFPIPDAEMGNTLPRIIIGRKGRHGCQVEYICTWPIGISGMSWGSLSEEAVRALSSGGLLADVHMATGEGGLTPYHVDGVIKRVPLKVTLRYYLALAKHYTLGGEKPKKPQGEVIGGTKLICQIGPAKFGFRRFILDPFMTPQGRQFRKIWSNELDWEKIAEVAKNGQIVMFEVKGGQGAKPGEGGKLPKEKITPELAEWRGIEMGKDCFSPNAWDEFHDIPGLVAFITRLQEVTGKPVGYKTPVGDDSFFKELAKYMKETGLGPDYICIDGGEGGTGAAPVILADSVGLPLLHAIPLVDNALREFGVRDDVVLIGSGQLARGDHMLIALAMGLDMVHVARANLIGGLGCIMALRCHTNRCPVGITTQDPRLRRGLDPQDKYVKVGNLNMVWQREIIMGCKALGVRHPWDLTRSHVTVVTAPLVSTKLSEIHPYPEGNDGKRSPRLAPKPESTPDSHDHRGPKLIKLGLGRVQHP